MKNEAFKFILTIVIAGVLVFGASFAKAETTQTNEGIIKILQNLIQTLIQMINQLFQQLAQRTTTPSTTTEPGGEDETATTPTPPIICIQEDEKVSINSDRFCCQHLVRIEIGAGATNFTCIVPNIKGTITSINSQNYSLNVRLLASEEVKIIHVWDSTYIVIDYTIEPPKTVGFESLKVGDSIEAWIETAVMGNYAHGINVISR